jgi:hypothetical protein
MLTLLLLLQDAGSFLIAASSGLVIGAIGGSALRSDKASRFRAVFWVTVVVSLALQVLCFITVGGADPWEVGQKLAGVVILQLLALAVAFHLVRRAARRNDSVALMSLNGAAGAPIGLLLSGVVKVLFGLLFVIYCVSGATCHW